MSNENGEARLAASITRQSPAPDALTSELARVGRESGLGSDGGGC